MVIGFYALLICLSSIRGNATSGEEPGSAGLLAARQEGTFPMDSRCGEEPGSVGLLALRMGRW